MPPLQTELTSQTSHHLTMGSTHLKQKKRKLSNFLLTLQQGGCQLHFMQKSLFILCVCFSFFFFSFFFCPLGGFYIAKDVDIVVFSFLMQGLFTLVCKAALLLGSYGSRKVLKKLPFQNI